MSFSKIAKTVLSILSIVVINATLYAQPIENIGLKQQWFSHSGITTGGTLADWYLDIDENQGTTYFEIVGGDYSQTLSENDLGPNGLPTGIELGLELANIKAEVVAARLKVETGKDVEVTVKQYTLPKSTLYTQSDNGAIRAIDAETGKIRWSRHVGNSKTKSIGIAGRGAYVAVLKGASVYCLDSETGAELWNHRCENAPAAPPQVDKEEIYVPLINGRIERFIVADKGFNTVSFVPGGSGTATTRPAISTNSFCWANYSGIVSVAARGSNRGMPGFQLTTNGAVFGVPQFKNGIYFVTSIDSYIYALSETKGSLIWENSTGFEITQAPFVLGNYVYVINDSNQLARFEAETGLLSAKWQKPRPDIGMFVGASSTKIYTINQAGRMKVLDQESGVVLVSASLGQVAKVLPNSKNDRIYLLNSSGTIRCYREITSEKPFFHSDEFKDLKPKTNDKDGSSTRPGPDDSNPFASPDDDDGGVNPFGGPSDDDGDDGADPNNPFGGGDDGGADPNNPFGGGDDDGADPNNPFGGGDDEENPFS